MADLTHTTAVAVLELSRLGRLTPETAEALADAVDPKPADEDDQAVTKTTTSKGATAR